MFEVLDAIISIQNGVIQYRSARVQFKTVLVYGLA